MSDYIKNNFLPDDHEEATKELDCYNYCLINAIEYLAINQPEKAAAYHDNASRSLMALSELRKKHDKAWFINKQNEADRTMKELIQSQLVKAYD